MRGRLLASIAFVSVLAAGGGLWAGISPTVQSPALSPVSFPGSAPSSIHAWASPLPPPPVPVWPFLSNSTLARADAPRGPVPDLALPNSAVSELPAPPVPATTPVVVTFGSSVRNCCIEQNFTAPSGTWATIVLNYTGRVVPDVFDSSYRVYIDGVQVVFGTSPEYGTWTVLQNLSEYQSLFSGTTNLTFLIGVAVPTGSPGYFLSNLSIAFYPVPSGALPHSEPNQIVPLWFRQPVQSSSQTVYVNATVPSNTSSATLELYVYAFNADEFWWANASAVRVVQFGTTGTNLGAMLPFPYVNTGGIDLLLWRPITAVYTTVNRPVELNLTGALGAIEGPHEYWANVTGVAKGATWLVGGALLLWTNASYLGASMTSNVYSGVHPTTLGHTESLSLHALDSSSISVVGGSRQVTSSETETFSGTSVSTLTSDNVTDLTTVAESTVTVSPTATTTEDRLYSFPIAADSGGSFVETSNTGGGYPIYGNFSDYLVNVDQQWNERRIVNVSGPLGVSVTTESVVDDQLGGASGVWAGTEEIPLFGAAPLVLTITFDSASSTKQFTVENGPPSSASTYSHLLVGVAYQPPGPYSPMTVLTDLVRSTPFPLLAQVQLAPAVVNVGGSTTISAFASGGYAPYSVLWTGLPPGCGAISSITVQCTPSAPGIFGVRLTLRDAAGALAPAASTYLLVNPVLQAIVRPLNASVDVGGSESFLAGVSGGSPPYSCAWAVNGGSLGAAGSCSPAFSYSPTVPGPLEVGVVVADGGSSAPATANASVPVGPPLSVSVSLPEGASRGAVGTAFPVDARVAGGVGPYSYAWFVNGQPIPGSGGANFTYLATAVGSYLIEVRTVDRSSETAASPGINLTVSAALSTVPVGSSSGSISSDWLTYLLIGIVVAQLAVIGLLLMTRRKATPPGPRKPPSKAAPAPSVRRPPPR